DPAVDQIGAERGMRPLGGIRLRHDVRVTLEEQALAAALLTEPGDDVRASGRDVLDLEVEPLLGEPGFHVAGNGGLGGIGVARTDDAGYPDKRSGEVDQLSF